MKDLVLAIERERKPRYIFREHAWFAVQGDYYKAWRAGVPRVLPAAKPTPNLRLVKGGRS